VRRLLYLLLVVTEIFHNESETRIYHPVYRAVSSDTSVCQVCSVLVQQYALVLPVLLSLTRLGLDTCTGLVSHVCVPEPSARQHRPARENTRELVLYIFDNLQDHKLHKVSHQLDTNEPGEPARHNPKYWKLFTNTLKKILYAWGRVVNVIKFWDVKYILMKQATQSKPPPSR
jgi:hypothetical protein